MQANTTKPIQLIDATVLKMNRETIVELAAGSHEVERVKNPYGIPEDFIVQKGTIIGAVESYWLRMGAVFNE